MTDWDKVLRDRLATAAPPMETIDAMTRQLIHVAHGVLKPDLSCEPVEHGGSGKPFASAFHGV